MKWNDAMFAVDGKSGKYPEFKGNVASVYSKPFNHGGSSNGHYGGNAETFMNVSEPWAGRWWSYSEKPSD